MRVADSLIRIENLKSRFRRLRYRKERRWGNDETYAELNLFQATDIRESYFGVEAVIADYDEDKFGHFQAAEGIRGEDVSPMSLEDILIAVSGRDMEEHP
jgi:hypothetical protein